MKREVGLWIDHHKTEMVTMVNEKEETWEIRSNNDGQFPQPWYGSGSCYWFSIPAADLFISPTGPGVRVQCF